MPMAVGNPARWPPRSSMWGSENSSFTAANRFQFSRSVALRNDGSSSPAATISELTLVGDQRQAEALHELVILVRPYIFRGPEQQAARASLSFVVVAQPGYRRNNIA